MNMKLLSALSASLALGLSSVQVQAWTDPFGSDDLGLYARSIEDFDDYDFGDLSSRDFEGPHADSTYAFKKRELEDLQEGFDILARDLKDLLDLRAPSVYRRSPVHHVHETIQPVIQKGTVTPAVVHTTTPVHEAQYNAPINHADTTQPPISLEDFKKKSGKVKGREVRPENSRVYRRAGSRGGSSGGSRGGSRAGSPAGTPSPPDSPSPPGSRGKDSREKTPPPVHQGYISVKQGYALYADFMVDKGIETVGLNGCTGIAVVGQQHTNAVLGHKTEKKDGALNDVVKWVNQYKVKGTATIVAPTERGQIMDPKEIQQITEALHKLGITSIVTKTYEYDENNMSETGIAIDRSGNIDIHTT